MKALFGRRTAASAAGADEPAAVSKPPATNGKTSYARGEQRRRTTSTPGASFFGMGASSSNNNSNNKNNVGLTRNGLVSSYYEPQDVSYPTSQGAGGAQEAARSNGKAGPRYSIAGTVGRGLKASRGRLSDTTQTGFSATAAAGVGDAPVNQVQPTSKSSGSGSGSGSGRATVGGGGIRDGNAQASSQGPSESAKQKVKNRYDSWRRASGAQTSKTSESSLSSPPAASHDLPAASRLGDAWNGPTSSGSRAKLSPAKELPDLPAGTVKKLAASPSGLVSTPGDEAPLYVMNAAGSSKVQRKTAPAAPVAQIQRPGEPQTSGARQESSSGTTTIAKGTVTASSPRDEGEADQQTTPRPDLPSSGHGELSSILMTPRAGNTTPRVGNATPTFSTMPRPHSSPGLDASDTQRLRSQKLATSSKASTMSRTPNALKNARNKLGSIARSRDSFFSPTSSADAAYNGDVVGEKAGRSKGSQSNHVGVANTAPPVSASAALASELNDLAVAHDEGLLGEEEYRLLRQGAFDRLMKNGAMELPQEGAIRGLGVMSADPDATIPRRRDTEPLASVLEQQQQQQQQQQKQQQQAYSRERASTLSQTPSVLSLLRRASLLSGRGSEKRTSTDQHQHLDPSSSSTASVRQHASNPTLGGRRLTSDSGSLFASNSSRVHSQYSGTSGGHGGTPSSTTRSLSNLRRGGSRRKKERAEELEEADRTARSTRSLRGAASQILVDPSSSLGVGDDSNASVARMSAMGLSISNGTSLLGVDYADKSSSEIKAERAVVEAEYARLLESFSAMEQMSMGKYSTLDYQQLKKAWALSALNHGGTMPDDIEDPDGNFVLVEGGGESEPVGTQTTKEGKRSSQTGKSNIRKTRSGPLLQPFNSSTGAASGSASSLNGAALLSPPSSYRGPGSPASSSPNNRSRTSLTSLSPPSSPNAPVRGGRAAGSYFSGAVIEAPQDEARSSGNTDEETAQRLILSLKTDLDEIAKRKQDVAAKYSARLDFLKSATRSALIREGLKR